MNVLQSTAQGPAELRSNAPFMECELKYALTDEADYNKLKAGLGQPARQLQQVNVYFDIPQLHGNGTLRLRSEKDLETQAEQLFLTFKVRPAATHFVPTAYYVAEEYETAITRDDWDCIYAARPREEQWQLEPMARLAQTVGPTAPRPIGTTTNLRLVYPGLLPTGAVAELDRTEFPRNRVDFELEVETDDPEPIESWIKARFLELKLALRPQPATKFRRFLDQLQQS